MANIELFVQVRVLNYFNEFISNANALIRYTIFSNAN